jgi:hypothetical protein
VTRLSGIFDIQLSLRNLVEAPTVAQLAEIVDGLSWVSRAPVPAAGSRDREETTL